MNPPIIASGLTSRGQLSYWKELIVHNSLTGPMVVVSNQILKKKLDVPFEMYPRVVVALLDRPKKNPRTVNDLDIAGLFSVFLRLMAEIRLTS